MLPQRIFIPDSLKLFAQREFAGETLRWVHQPSPRSAFKSALFIWFFAIPWTTFTLVWEGTAISQYLSQSPKSSGMGHIAMVLWGIPFVLVGFGMMSAPFWAWHEAKNSLWILTNRRLSFLTARRHAVKIRSVMPSDILAIVRKQWPDGTGDLTLTYQSTRDSDGDRKERSDTLNRVPDARALEEMIRDMKTPSRT